MMWALKVVTICWWSISKALKVQASIVRIQQDGDDIIKVQFDKTTSFRNNRITEVGNAY